MRPLFSLLLRCTCSFGTPGFVRLSQPLVSCFWLKLLLHTSWDINNIFLVLLDAFSSRFFKTNFLLLYTLFSATFICFMFPLLYLLIARCSFRLFPNFRWDAFWGIYSDVILPYLSYLAILLVQVSCQNLEQDGWFKQQYFTRCYESRYFPWEFWCF